MLANQILRPEGLDYFIESSHDYRSILEINLTEQYRTDSFKEDIISYFIWLKFNKAAEKSWNSVYKNLILDASMNNKGDINNSLRKGIPLRVIPPLNGTSTWTFRGVEYKNHRLILELVHRSNLEMPFENIICSHPKFEKLETDNKKRYTKDPTKKPNDDKDVELDTSGQGAEKPQNHTVIEQPPVMFSFKIKPRIFKKKNKTRKIHNGDIVVIGTKEEDESNIGTTQDWVQGGSIPQIEFSILKMVDINMSKGLLEFLKMIEYMHLHYKSLILSLIIVPLPQLKNFSYYEDGSIRTCAIVRVERKNHMPCYIIEIGRADDWSISTLIVKPIKSENVDVKVIEGLTQRLLRDLVDNNGHWDREFFRNETGYIFDTAKHMTHQLVVRWADRIVEKVKLLSF